MTFVLGPTIASDRLRLRPPTEGDFAALREFGKSADRMRFLGGPVDANAQWRTLLADMGHWALRGYGLFSIEVAESGLFVGRAGPIFHNHDHEPELACTSSKASRAGAMLPRRLPPRATGTTRRRATARCRAG